MERGTHFLLPYGEDHDQHYTAANQIRTLPTYEFDESLRRIAIDDPVWGKCEIGDWEGDEVFFDLYLNALVQRSAAIEQLTLPKHFATMPGSTEMSRWEHLWGSVVFVRHMIEQAEVNGIVFDSREKTVLQLRTFVSDLGHTAFSHLGDWLFQGYGGSEDQHDQELGELLELTGVNEILRTHDIDPEEVIFPEIDDWIECSAPDLCVDRVDYGAREMLRWVSGYEPTEVWKSRFVLDKQKRIVMSSKEEAKQFALQFGLLATEHWGQPTHRLQLQLFGELVRSVVSSDNLVGMGWDYIRHPRDLLYALDSNINGGSRAVGDLNYDLFGVILDVARAQRKVFAYGRHRDIELALLHMTAYADGDSEHNAFPDPLVAKSWESRYSGTKPGNIEFIVAQSPEELPDFGTLAHTLDIFLPPLKARVIDPLFFDGTTVKRLSDEDQHFAHIKEDILAYQKRGYVARLHGAPDFLQSIKDKLITVSEAWNESLGYARAEEATFKSMINHVGRLAITSSSAEIRYY
jgi:hypothetical protein